MARAYDRFHEVVEFAGRVRVLRMSDAAANGYFDLRTQYRRTGKQDLKIAAIVLETDQAILVTRNRSDFDPIEGLRIEDWSCPSD